VAVSSDGKNIAVSNSRGLVDIYDVESRERHGTIVQCEPIERVFFGRDSGMIWIRSNLHKLTGWFWRFNELVFDSDIRVDQRFFETSNPHRLIASSDGRTHIWEFNRSLERRYAEISLGGFPDYWNGPGSEQILPVVQHHELRLIDIRDGKPCGDPFKFDDAITSVKVSPTDDWVLVILRGVSRLYRIGSGELIAELQHGLDLRHSPFVIGCR
jgi:WD40 repeat protein